jgi:hypothetical protein
MALIDSPRLSLPSVDDERDHTSATPLTEERLTPNKWAASLFSSLALRLLLVCWQVCFHEVVMSYGSMLLQDAVGEDIIRAGRNQNLMYVGLRISDTLHKKTYYIGPGLRELPRIL